MDRLSEEFNRGYTKAIQDVIEIFECIQSDLEHHPKRLNGKLAIQLLKVILENRATGVLEQLTTIVRNVKN